MAKFQSTLPVWGATNPHTLPRLVGYISIHAPRVGSDDKHLIELFSLGNFNPRSPCGERQALPGRTKPRRKFQSTLPVWGATDDAVNTYQAVVISIHAPRVGSDRREPHERNKPVYFNPRSPCGERRTTNGWWTWLPPISIHAPRVGSDLSAVERQKALAEFQSTLPVWGATADNANKMGTSMISIHAPRVGSDERDIADKQSGENFNPRSPCGERRKRKIQNIQNRAFQSTLPVWGATTFRLR